MLLTAGLGMVGLVGGAVSARVADVQVMLMPVSLASLVLAFPLPLAAARPHGGRAERSG